MAVLASVAVLVSTAVLPVPQCGGSPYKIHWSGCPFKLARRFPGSTIVSAGAVGHHMGNHTDPDALSAGNWNT